MRPFEHVNARRTELTSPRSTLLGTSRTRMSIVGQPYASSWTAWTRRPVLDLAEQAQNISEKTSRRLYFFPTTFAVVVRSTGIGLLRFLLHPTPHM